MENKIKVYYYVYCASKTGLYCGDLIKEINHCASLDYIDLNNYIHRQIRLDVISLGNEKVYATVENIYNPMIRLYWRKRIFRGQYS